MNILPLLLNDARSLRIFRRPLKKAKWLVRSPRQARDFQQAGDPEYERFLNFGERSTLSEPNALGRERKLGWWVWIHALPLNDGVRSITSMIKGTYLEIVTAGLDFF